VIGAGIGGLTAGALLSHGGKNVLVVEAEARLGGDAQSLCHGAYTFDRAVHLISGCEATSRFGPGIIDGVLRRLGVRDRCEFIRIDDPIYQACFPGLAVSVPYGREGYLEAHLRHFPGDAVGLRRLSELSAQILLELTASPAKVRIRDVLGSPWRFRTLLRYRNATMRDVIDRELTDSRLKAVYAALWPWVGPPPSRASFLVWATMMAGYVEDGAYYCLGSYQRLADALAAALVEAGGELLLGARVTGIFTERGRISGVALESGDRITATDVISTVNARETFERLVGSDHVPVRYLRRLRAMEVSHHLLVLYVATDLDVRALGAQHDMSIFVDWDHGKVHAGVLAGEVPYLSVMIPTLKDSSLAPPGEHLVILQAIAPPRAEGAGENDGYLADRMLQLAERVLPGLRRHLTFVRKGPGGEVVSVLGPYLGWTLTPEQVGIRRLSPQTPIRGLRLVGQWTQPGPSIRTVMGSGVDAARLLLNPSASSTVLLRS
jgi:prolycopene isomerase